MYAPRRLVPVLLPVLLLFASENLPPITADAGDLPDIVSQEEEDASGHDLTGQSGDSRSLEIGPQSSNQVADSRIDEIDGSRKFKPSDGCDLDDRSFEPKATTGSSFGEKGRSARLPKAYLGMEVRFVEECFIDKPLQGLEVVKLPLDSPAARGGIHAYVAPSTAGKIGLGASAFLGPLDAFVIPLIARTGALGSSGDMLVAVDDNRVRTPEELERAIAALKPGDQCYLTVLRPLPNGGHRTLRIAITLGQVKVDDRGSTATASAGDSARNF